MSLTVLNFGGCCTAKIITGFGQSNTAQYGDHHPLSEAEMKRQVDALIRGPMIGRRNGLAVATITSAQTVADKVLTEMGFKDSGWGEKLGHAETQLKMFYINPAEYLDANPTPVPAAPKPQRAGLVKNLRPEMRRRYNSHLRMARQYSWNLASQSAHRDAAEQILQNPANFVPQFA